jgi:hypothetical protein
MLAGVRWIQWPSFDFIESVRNPGHPYHQLLVATHKIQSAVHSGRIEQKDKRSHTAHRGIIRDHEDFASYRPRFLGNLQDMMIPLVGAQKSLPRPRARKRQEPSMTREEVVRLVLANLDTLSLPARMKREAALKKSHTRRFDTPINPWRINLLRSCHYCLQPWEAPENSG